MHRSYYDMKITSFHIEPNMIIFDQGVKQNENLKTKKRKQRLLRENQHQKLKLRLQLIKKKRPRKNLVRKQLNQKLRK